MEQMSRHAAVFQASLGWGCAGGGGMGWLGGSLMTDQTCNCDLWLLMHEIFVYRIKAEILNYSLFDQSVTGFHLPIKACPG